MSLPNDPNGRNWHEPKCDSCGRFDADCDCTVAKVAEKGIREGRVGKWTVEHLGDYRKPRP